MQNRWFHFALTIAIWQCKTHQDVSINQPEPCLCVCVFRSICCVTDAEMATKPKTKIDHSIQLPHSSRPTVHGVMNVSKIESTNRRAPNGCDCCGLSILSTFCTTRSRSMSGKLLFDKLQFSYHPNRFAAHCVCVTWIFCVGASHPETAFLLKPDKFTRHHMTFLLPVSSMPHMLVFVSGTARVAMQQLNEVVKCANGNEGTGTQNTEPRKRRYTLTLIDYLYNMNITMCATWVTRSPITWLD